MGVGVGGARQCYQFIPHPLMSLALLPCPSPTCLLQSHKKAVTKWEKAGSPPFKPAAQQSIQAAFLSGVDAVRQKERERRRPHFVWMWHTLQCQSSMLKYEKDGKVLEYLQTPGVIPKHWTDVSGALELVQGCPELCIRGIAWLPYMTLQCNPPHHALFPLQAGRLLRR